ncbi:RluA family pseudouridine synthase [Spirochaetota bacterium]
MSDKNIILNVGPNDSGRRLDRIIRKLFGELPLSAIYKLFRNGKIKVNGKKTDSAYRCAYGDIIEVDLPDGLLQDFPVTSSKNAGRPEGFENADCLASEQNKRFSSLVLFETPDLCVVNKPKGMLSHGPGGLNELAKAYYRKRIEESLIFSPAPLHRLDRNSSGAIAIAASQLGAAAFSKALRDGKIDKYYLALVSGKLSQKAVWEDKILRNRQTKQSSVHKDGVHAKLEAFPLLFNETASLVLIRLHTGITHQIRVQAAARGFPLLGDKKYMGKRTSTNGYFLHAALLYLPKEAGLDKPKAILAPLSTWAKQFLFDVFGADYGPEAVKALDLYMHDYMVELKKLF